MRKIAFKWVLIIGFVHFMIPMTLWLVDAHQLKQQIYQLQHELKQTNDSLIQIQTDLEWKLDSLDIMVYE